jgi:hypothetical protein
MIDATDTKVAKKTYNAAYYQANREKILQQVAEYQNRNRGTLLPKKRIKSREHYRTPVGWATKIISGLKQRAAGAELPFDLTADDLLRMRHNSSNCPYYPELGPLTYGTGVMFPTTAHVDRVRPELGYTRGNVILISARANRQKQDMTLAEMKRVVSVTEKIIKASDRRIAELKEAA